MDIKRIELAIQLLSDVETKGAKNLNNLLGAIQLLEGFKKEASLPEFPLPVGGNDGTT